MQALKCLLVEMRNVCWNFPCALWVFAAFPGCVLLTALLMPLCFSPGGLDTSWIT